MDNSHLDTPRARAVLGDILRELIDLRDLTGTLIACHDADIAMTDPMWNMLRRRTWDAYQATMKAGIEPQPNFERIEGNPYSHMLVDYGFNASFNGPQPEPVFHISDMECAWDEGWDAGQRVD